MFKRLIFIKNTRNNFIFKFSSSPKDFSDIANAPNLDIDTKIQQLEQNQPLFDRLIFFDPDVMASLPKPLQIFDPIVETSKDLFVALHNCTGLPWWAILGIACGLIRACIMPLIYLQMKRTSRLAAIAPVLIQAKKLADHAMEKKHVKYFLLSKFCFQTIRSQKLKVLRLFLYNLVNIPIIIDVVWSIRRLLIEDSFKNTSVLWIPTLSGIDPYYIVPFLTVSLYYFNFGRFITEENKHTIISRIRNGLQVLSICSLPILCNWPSAISIYMFYNAIFTYIQTSIMVHPKFMKMANPKMVLYQYLLRMVEHDKAQSQSLIEGIKTGEESHLEKSITEEVLVEQVKSMIKKADFDTEEKKINWRKKLKERFFNE